MVQAELDDALEQCRFAVRAEIEQEMTAAAAVSSASAKESTAKVIEVSEDLARLQAELGAARDDLGRKNSDLLVLAGVILFYFAFPCYCSVP